MRRFMTDTTNTQGSNERKLQHLQVTEISDNEIASILKRAKSKLADSSKVTDTSAMNTRARFLSGRYCE